MEAIIHEIELTYFGLSFRVHLMEDDKKLSEVLFALNQELKIRNNELDIEVREAQKRAEEAGYKAQEQLKQIFDVALYGTALVGTAVAALTVINSM